MNLDEFLKQRLRRGMVRRLNNVQIARMARRLARMAPTPSGAPVAFFKASTGIDDLSWNSGFHLLASWSLRLQGVPVVYFACQSGMSRCVLGTNRDNVHQLPPCKSCIYQSRTLYTGVRERRESSSPRAEESQVHWFSFDREARLESALRGLRLDQLMAFCWAGKPTITEPTRGEEADATGESESLPLGDLCVASLRWILRRHNLDDDEDTRFLMREYILSGWNVARKFSRFLDETRPRAVVLFNGQFFPEAIARHVARERGLRVITHEVGLQPASAFFTEGEATAYPIRIPESFQLSQAQNARLDEYLEKRFQGRFTMAGIQFWPTMRGLDEAFNAKAAAFKQIVPVFTNVIFDTSQPHANTVFPDMFAWLDMALGEMRSHPDTLFVIRAHPDETRTRKASRETVQEWVQASGALALANVLFIPPEEYLSSYELIQRAKFVMVYNSTIGLEASILGKPVLCGGRARFTQYPTVFFPGSAAEQRAMMKHLLTTDSIPVPPEFANNARRFLYYQLFRTSLPFEEYLVPSVRPTQARLKSFDLHRLSPEHSPALKAISRGLLAEGEFLLDESLGSGSD